ncbi:hypothetical protein EVAR_12223_1 [Eumeta japonica]|uniref:Uncharacterized protein n=1 Tax=Eumeta variegata TaxID=151549 RepID=A0A4C1UGZ0_EUMVA|nr:hypothetical protein EVAR_12223_1 [Eumeta japonica]
MNLLERVRVPIAHALLHQPTRSSITIIPFIGRISYSHPRGRQHTYDDSGIAERPWAAVTVCFFVARALVCLLICYKKKIVRGVAPRGRSEIS